MTIIFANIVSKYEFLELRISYIYIFYVIYSLILLFFVEGQGYIICGYQVKQLLKNSFYVFMA